MPITFITGPVRSGKSRMAERLAQKTGLRLTYVATAQRDPNDTEWNARIDRHIADRPPTWSTLESAELTTTALNERVRTAAADECLLVDALGTWLGVRIAAHADQIPNAYEAVEKLLDEEATALADAIAASQAHIIVVAEQVGWDIVPIVPSARLFRDVLGRLSQRIAKNGNEKYLVVAGHALPLTHRIDSI